MDITHFQLIVFLFVCVNTKLNVYFSSEILYFLSSTIRNFLFFLDPFSCDEQLKRGSLFTKRRKDCKLYQIEEKNTSFYVIFILFDCLQKIHLKFAVLGKIQFYQLINYVGKQTLFMLI